MPTLHATYLLSSRQFNPAPSRFARSCASLPRAQARLVGAAMVSGSATAVACLNWNLLSLSDNVAVESLLQDIPFFSVGVLGFAVATVMFVCRGMVRPGIFLLVSIVLAFVAATLDLFRILYEVNSMQMDQVSGLFIAREVCVALSHSSRLLYFWDYASRPPIPPIMRPPWSMVRMLLDGSIILGCVGVAILQTVWRIAPNGLNQYPVYMADDTLELVLAAVLILMIARHWFARPPAWYIRRSVPVMAAIVIGMGVVITNFFIWDFSDMLLGRFIQAIQMYVAALVVLVQSTDAAVAYALAEAEVDINDQTRPSFSNRRNSSFVAVSGSVARSDPSRGVSRPSLSVRMPTVERMSNWIQNRISMRPPEPTDAARLWKPETSIRDLESQVVTVDEKYMLAPETAAMDASPGFTAQPVAAPTWSAPTFTSVADVESPSTSEEFGFVKVPAPARPESNTLLPITPPPPRPNPDRASKLSRRSSIGTSVLLQPPLTRQSSDDSNLAYRRRSMTDSPVYGLEGIIRGLGLAPPTPAGSGTVAVSRSTDNVSEDREPTPQSKTFLARQAELDDSLAKLDSLYPAEQRKSLALALDQMVPGSSYTSEFSLSTFPVPPSAGGEQGRSRRSARMTVDDVEFDLVPPPRVLSGYPETTASEDSLVAEYYANAVTEGRPSVDAFATGRAKQLDVTSFIGDLTVPRPIGELGPGGSEPGTPNSAVIIDMSAMQSSARATLASPKFLFAPPQERAPLPSSPLALGSLSGQQGRVSPTRTANPPAAMLRGPAPLRDGAITGTASPPPMVALPMPPIRAVTRSDAAPLPAVQALQIQQRNRTGSNALDDRPRLATIEDLRALSPPGGSPTPTISRMGSREDILARMGSREDMQMSPRPGPGKKGHVRNLTISRPQLQLAPTQTQFERPRAAPEPGSG